MTIRDTNNWCPTCEEACHHHPTHCTVCGTRLEAPPPPRTSNARNRNIRVSPVPGSLRQETQDAAQELRQRLQSLRQQVQDTGQRQQELLALVQNMQQEFQTIPAEALDPQQGAHSRPTSQDFLDQIPRTVLTEHSPWLYEAVVKVQSFPLKQVEEKVSKEEKDNVIEEEIEGIMADFDLATPPQTQEGALIVSQPRTGLGGLSAQTKEAIQNHQSLHENKNSARATICLMERGDGVTFAQKALMVQKEGATACIIANNTDEPWPYIMKDSKGEAKNGPVKLKIPTVMIPRARAQTLFAAAGVPSSRLTCVLKIAPSEHRDCVVCTDPLLQKGSTVLRLPPCGHVFHETCVLQWLAQHNTCPFCRRELPTDDQEYERERRREQRTHAGSSGGTNDSQNDGSAAAVQDFYG